MIEPTKTRGYLNNNPGNLDRGAQPWYGEIRDLDKCQNDVQRGELTHGRFCVFQNAVLGIRAMAKNLLAYHDRLQCETIREYIERWAPPNENNTQAYIANVAGRVGVSSDEPVDIRNPEVMAAIIDGIIRVECGGMPYTGNEIAEGMQLAGIG
jgi:hypothetical protein